MPLTLIGTTTFRGKAKPIYIKDIDRLRHTYVVGKTGVGKSTVLQAMCLQDVTNYHGVCFIDPHGDAIEWLLRRIPANRLEDVILFDPSDAEYPFGLNLLEAHDESERDFLVAETIAIFYKLFDPERTGIIGPQFEHWLRNAALTVMAGSEGGSVIEIPKLFVDKRYEMSKRQHLTDPLVQEFWAKQMARTADFHKSEMLNYFMSKFGHFLNNTLMRNILGQHRSSFNFDEVITKEKILLVNLSKGKVGDINAQMLGLVLLAKLQAAILKRARADATTRTPFYLYVDEFQNFVTDTFVSMLSESRKYGLGVHVANQYFSQLPRALQDAVLGNVGTMLAFEVGVDDAERLAREFAPMESNDFLHLARFHFYIKMMIDGKTTDAFSGETVPPSAEASEATRQNILSINALAYGTPRVLVEEQIKKHLI